MNTEHSKRRAITPRHPALKTPRPASQLVRSLYCLEGALSLHACRVNERIDYKVESSNFQCLTLILRADNSIHPAYRVMGVYKIHNRGLHIGGSIFV